MKNVIILFLSFLTISALAQEEELTKQDLKAREKLASVKIAFITERLGLTPEEAEKFWPVYNEFAQKREELRKQFKENRKNPDPNKPAEQTEKEVIDNGLQLKQQELDLEKEYSGKLLKVVPAQKVIALRKAEVDFRNLLIKQIQQREVLKQQRQQQRDRNDQRFRQRNN